MSGGPLCCPQRSFPRWLTLAPALHAVGYPGDRPVRRGDFRFRPAHLVWPRCWMSLWYGTTHVTAKCMFSLYINCYPSHLAASRVFTHFSGVLVRCRFLLFLELLNLVETYLMAAGVAFRESGCFQTPPVGGSPSQTHFNLQHVAQISSGGTTEYQLGNTIRRFFRF